MLSNWVGYVAQIAIAFVLTPIILHALGDARYGVWAIVVGITGYYGLLDLGFRAGMTQYITRYYAAGDYARMNGAASSGLALHICCAACVAIVTIIVAWASPTFFSLPADLKHELSQCVFILGGSTAVQFLLFPFSIALTAKQRFGIVTSIGVVTRLLAAVATVTCLAAGYGLIAICTVSALTNIADYSLRGIIACRILPELRFSLRRVSWASCRECMEFGFWSALISVSTLIIRFSDAVVIGIFMPVSAIAFFTLANNLIKYFANIFIPVGHVFFPAATALDARNDLDALRRLYLTASRMIALQAVGIALIACFWANDFYLLWVGNEYLENKVYPAVPLLFQLLLLGAVFTAAQRIGSKVLLGRRRMRGIAILFCCEAALNLALSIALIKPYGLLGVAIGTVLPALVCQGVLHPILVCSDLQLGVKDYSKAVLGPTLIVCICLSPLLFCLHQLTTHHSWAALMAEGAAASTIALTVIAALGLTPGDRERYLYPLLQRMVRGRPASLPTNQ